MTECRVTQSEESGAPEDREKRVDGRNYTDGRDDDHLRKSRHFRVRVFRGAAHTPAAPEDVAEIHAQGQAPGECNIAHKMILSGKARKTGEKARS